MVTARLCKEKRALAGGAEEKKRVRRSYHPTLEVIEALRLLSSATAATPLPGLAAEHNLLADPAPAAMPRLDGLPSVSSANVRPMVERAT